MAQKQTFALTDFNDSHEKGHHEHKTNGKVFIQRNGFGKYDVYGQGYKGALKQTHKGLSSLETAVEKLNTSDKNERRYY